MKQSDLNAKIIVAQRNEGRIVIVDSQLGYIAQTVQVDNYKNLADNYVDLSYIVKFAHTKKTKTVPIDDVKYAVVANVNIDALKMRMPGLTDFKLYDMENPKLVFIFGEGPIEKATELLDNLMIELRNQILVSEYECDNIAFSVESDWSKEAGFTFTARISSNYVSIIFKQ